MKVTTVFFVLIIISVLEVMICSIRDFMEFNDIGNATMVFVLCWLFVFIVSTIYFRILL